MARDDDGGISGGGRRRGRRLERAPDLVWGDSGITCSAGLYALAVTSPSVSPAALLPWRDGGFLVGLHPGYRYRVVRVLPDGQIDQNFGTNGSLRGEPRQFNDFFGLLADGVWVLYRANMKHDVRATHYVMN